MTDITVMVSYRLQPDQVQAALRAIGSLVSTVLTSEPACKGIDYSHGKRAAEEIRSLGQSLRASDDCLTTEMLFNDQAALILDKYRLADAAYDAETKHGQTQGATFP